MGSWYMKSILKMEMVNNGVIIQNAGIVVKELKWDGVIAMVPVLLLLGSYLSSSKIISYSCTDDTHNKHEVRINS